MALAIQKQNVSKVDALFQSIDSDSDKKSLANLVMTGGARPLHICGMSSAVDIMKVLIKNGADVNAKDNYEWTPMDRAIFSRAGKDLLKNHGGKSGKELKKGQPEWDSDEFAYTGPGEVEKTSGQ